MRILVLSNAAAARARRHVPALRAALPETSSAAVAAGGDVAAGAKATGAPIIDHRVTEGPEPVGALVAHDRWRPDDVLVINGGDGTVQHALTLLLGHCPPERLPRIACLPGGTTNMTAFDLNRHRGFKECLATLRHANPAALPVAPRPVVRVRPMHGAPEDARCGLFFGIGSIIQGIEYFQARIRDNGGAHELGAGLALLRALWGITRREPPFDRPLTVQVTASVPAACATGCAFRFGAGSEPVAARLLLATTLDRLFLGIRPYWGTGPGPLRSTLVEARAPGFVTRMPRLLRGRPDARMTPRLGYHSARVDALALRFAGSYTLDGELFSGAGDTMRVSTTEPVRFLRL